MCDPHLAPCFWMAYLRDLYSSHTHLCWCHSIHIVLERQQHITFRRRQSVLTVRSYSKCLTDSIRHISQLAAVYRKLVKNNVIQTDRQELCFFLLCINIMCFLTTSIGKNGKDISLKLEAFHLVQMYSLHSSVHHCCHLTHSH